MSIILRAGLVFGLMIAVLEGGAWAAKAKGETYSSHSAPESRSYSQQEMLADLSIHYVRDTKPDGGTDTAARFSLGGMFNEWLGLDAQGLFEVKAKNYLVGGDVRIAPVDWFFMKGGVGTYSSKATHTLTFTPLAGVGLMARLTRDYYFQAESSYFSVNDRDNISFGVGFGIIF